MKHLLTILLALSFALPGRAIEPPALSKADAKRLLEVMEWREPAVITVRQGISGKGEVAPIYATIVGFGMRDSRPHVIQQTVHHDAEYGWFFYELSEKSARLWTKEGFREVKPFAATLLNHRVPNP
jgi:hypothetical protein